METTLQELLRLHSLQASESYIVQDTVHPEKDFVHFEMLKLQKPFRTIR